MWSRAAALLQPGARTAGWQLPLADRKPAVGPAAGYRRLWWGDRSSDSRFSDWNEFLAVDSSYGCVVRDCGAATARNRRAGPELPLADLEHPIGHSIHCQCVTYGTQ